MGRWKRPKEAWEEQVCTFCTFGAVEPEKHFIMECDAFRDIRDIYGSVLASIPWHCLFSESTVRRLGQLIINLNKKMIELQKEKNKEAGSPIDYF